MNAIQYIHDIIYSNYKKEIFIVMDSFFITLISVHHRSKNTTLNYNNNCNYYYCNNPWLIE